MKVFMHNPGLMTWLPSIPGSMAWQHQTPSKDKGSIEESLAPGRIRI